ncbi:hypothetical protein [Corynebacterium sp.]|uniref:hypothetical protein n=1 Tax=Corynebacterium sp. TaxID=1720 RepID=UPI0025C33624|nr:hypothetical protein [Corynebacterium sp.]
MSDDSDQYREYLTHLADGITSITAQDRTASDGAKVLAAAGLIRWSGAPHSSGWAPTPTGRTILTNFRRRT